MEDSRERIPQSAIRNPHSVGYRAIDGAVADRIADADVCGDCRGRLSIDLGPTDRARRGVARLVRGVAGGVVGRGLRARTPAAGGTAASPVWLCRLDGDDSGDGGPADCGRPTGRSTGDGHHCRPAVFGHSVFTAAARPGMVRARAADGTTELGWQRSTTTKMRISRP